MTAYIAMALLVLMILGMLSNKFEFGVVPFLAIVASVVLGCATIEQAFSGFTNKYLVMTAASLILSNALNKTNFKNVVRDAAMKLVNGKRGFLLFALVLIAAALASFAPGPSYMLILMVLMALPENDSLAPTQMLLPITCFNGICSGKIPYTSIVMFLGMLNGYLQSGGSTLEVSLPGLLAAGVLPLVAMFIYSLVAFRMLPKRAISATLDDDDKGKVTELLPKGKQIFTYVILIASFCSLMLEGLIGDIIYVLPAVGVFILIFSGCVTVKEARSTLSSGMVLMLGSVFGFAAVLEASGATNLFSSWVLNIVGANPNPWVLIVVFTVLAMVMVNTTGGGMATQMLFIPMATSVCIALGLDPRPVAIATFAGSFCTCILPIDTNTAICMSVGKYKMSEMLKYTIPFGVLYVITVCIGAVLVYPF